MNPAYRPTRPSSASDQHLFGQVRAPARTESATRPRTESTAALVRSSESGHTVPQRMRRDPVQPGPLHGWPPDPVGESSAPDRRARLGGEAEGDTCAESATSRLRSNTYLTPLISRVIGLLAAARASPRTIAVPPTKPKYGTSSVGS